MGKLTVTQFITLDGVIESPEEWNSHYQNDDVLTRDILNDFSSCDRLLFGRTTYSFLGARWPERTGRMADLFNSLPKYVVSSTLKEAKWRNSTLINKNFNEEIKELKENSKNILVWGSHRLVQTLREENLVDEYKLYIYPLILGKGKRLFEKGTTRRSLKLVGSKALATGVTILTYQTL